MNRLLREVTRLSFSQWVTLISLLILLNLVVMAGLLWIIASDVAPEDTTFTQDVLAQAPATRTPNPTFTMEFPYPTLTPFPTSTSTLVPTWTPSITPTPLPTATPTSTPIPTATPVVVRAKSLPPPATHTPTPSPTPNVDFAATVRQLTPCENQGKHHIFIYVVDQHDNGIPGMQVKVSWPGGQATVETGTKVEHSGLADFAMFKGVYHLEVLGALSEVVGPITPDIPRDETCKENGNPVGNSLFHYSYEVIFKKVR